MAFYSSRNNMFHFLKSYFKPSRNISKRNDVKNDLICVVLLGEYFFWILNLVESNTGSDFPWVLFYTSFVSDSKLAWCIQLDLQHFAAGK